ncbi:MAG TPA: sporulation protein [Mycobacterium sp.]|nr:sporulation protein [Mycobacterium sp.]
MKVDEILAVARDSMTVRRVYAEPVERDGVTVIAAASVTGGGGAGSGIEQGKEGSGGGFGLGAKPVGAYVIKDGRVTWRPAIDFNRLITVIGVVMLAGIVAGSRIARKAIGSGHS